MSKLINISSSVSALPSGAGGGSASLPAEWDQVLAAMHRHANKSALDLIKWDEDLHSWIFEGNVLATGGMASYFDLEGEPPSIFDHLPIASDIVKGIASFDPEYFSVVDGEVTFIGGGGGEGGYLESVTGSGNGTMTFKQSNHADITFNSSHTHSQYLTGISKAMIEAVLTGNITSHYHSQYLTGISKAMVEAVLTGNITSHTHSQYLNTTTSRSINTFFAAPATSNGAPSWRKIVNADINGLSPSFTSVTINGILIDVSGGNLRVNGNIIATGGMASQRTI